MYCHRARGTGPPWFRAGVEITQKDQSASALCRTNRIAWLITEEVTGGMCLARFTIAEFGGFIQQLHQLLEDNWWPSSPLSLNDDRRIKLHVSPLGEGSVVVVYIS
jgi:hypothetical protein